MDLDADLPSRRDCVDAPLLSTADTECYLALYLRGPDKPSPYAMPLLAVDFSGLPQALIAVAQFDPLRDDGMLYAERLQGAGVAATLASHPAPGPPWMNTTGKPSGEPLSSTYRTWVSSTARSCRA